MRPHATTSKHRSPRPRSFILTLLFVIIACAPFRATVLLGGDAAFTRTGIIKSEALGEISGIAPSLAWKSTFWAINDSGHPPVLYAVSAGGEMLGSVRLANVSNRDWEDLASFRYRGSPYLMVADVGDNRAKWESCKLHLVREPDIGKLRKAGEVIQKPETTVEYVYEDGPRDCESVAVDVNEKAIFLLSKRDKPPRLYQLPLDLSPKAGKRFTAKFLTTVTTIPQPPEDVSQDHPVYKYGGQPTAMDLSADGNILAVLTYLNLSLYARRSGGESLTKTLAASPVVYPLPFLQQAEAVAFDRSGKAVYLSSEKLPAPVLKIDLAENGGKR